MVVKVTQQGSQRSDAKQICGSRSHTPMGVEGMEGAQRVDNDSSLRILFDTILTCGTTLIFYIPPKWKRMKAKKIRKDKEENSTIEYKDKTNHTSKE